MRPGKIVSGGQTGVDRAALDAAFELGIPCGGWCPKGRHAEDGRIAARYTLQETPSADYSVRTEWNVRDSNGTLALVEGAPSGGTAFTIELAREYRRPLLVIDLRDRPDPARVGAWLAAEAIVVLNVAGPRESNAPGIHDRALQFLRTALGPPSSTPATGSS